MILTYRCNQGCSYCYEKGMLLTGDDMSLDDFEKALIWLRGNRQDKIILMGGEPTQHPSFKEVLILCAKYRMSVTILTNMMFDHSVASAIAGYDRCCLQVNINHPLTYQQSGAYERIRSMLKDLAPKMIMVVLRYNIYDKNEDCLPVLRLAREIKSTIRFSVVNSPLCDKVVSDDKKDVKNIYQKEKIVDFIEACRREGVGAFFARPVPKCLFTKQEIKRYRRYAIKFKCFVGRNGNYAARLNISPDLTTLGCYGVPIKGPRLTDFKDLKNVSDYYRKHFVRLRCLPLTSECLSCRDYYDDICQGGCLSEKEAWVV